MRVAVFAVDGMFDSGLTVVLDILGTANTLSELAGLAAPPFAVTTVGLGPRVRTALGLELATTPWRETLADPPEVAVCRPWDCGPRRRSSA